MTVFSRCIAVLAVTTALAGAGSAAIAQDDVPLPRPAPESVRPDQSAPAQPAQPAQTVQAAAAATTASPVIGAKAAEFQRVQSWTVKCRTGGEKHCILYQTVLFGDENPSVIVARAGYVPGAADPVLEVRVPMGVRLATGLTVAVDGQPAATLAFERCAQDGCIAQTTLNRELLGKMKAGQTLDLKLEDQARNAIQVRLSLVGFSAALGMAK